LENQIYDIQQALDLRTAQYERMKESRELCERKLNESIIIGDENRRGKISAETHVSML
jgi:hypothetical protein